jgi:hypothetical protein
MQFEMGSASHSQDRFDEIGFGSENLPDLVSKLHKFLGVTTWHIVAENCHVPNADRNELPNFQSEEGPSDPKVDYQRSFRKLAGTVDGSRPALERNGTLIVGLKWGYDGHHDGR